MHTILVTGFEPFGGFARNPSQEVIAALPGELTSGCRIVAQLLPVDVTSAPGLAIEVADAHSVDAIVGLGLAGGSVAIRIERLFANLYEHDQRSSPLVDGAPDGLFSTLPVQQMVAGATAAGATVQQSMSAGLYVCNALGFMLRQTRPHIPSGFIHLPMTPGPGAESAPTITLTTAVSGVTAMLESLDSWLDTDPSQPVLGRSLLG